ncbi:nuclear transport factor 2 family protein [Amycolatopsis sp. KNN50.9b]|uniref:nuclear transport factor 2 family protein n=1 Tax=Amycolatopsis sp. KNN50.9b TaxID=2018303 RepID=UPI0026990D05
MCTASFQATHYKKAEFGSPLWRLGGTYEFALVRGADGWRITGVVMTATWGEGNR